MTRTPDGMRTGADAGTDPEHDLRRAVRGICDQICQAVDGDVDFVVRSESRDEDVQKLAQRINVLRDAGGRLIEKAERQKRELDARVAQRSLLLKAVFDTLMDGLIVISDAGVVLDANQAAGRMFAWEGAMTGLNVGRLIPEAENLLRESSQMQSGRVGEPQGIVFGCESQGRRRDGALFPMYLSIVEVCLDGHARFIGLLRDLSAEKAQQAALLQERNFIQGLFDAMPDVVYAFDTKLRFLRWNQATLDVVGMDAETFARSSVQGHLAMRDWPSVLKTIVEVFSKGYGRVVARVKVADGSLRPYEFVAAKLKDADGKLLGLVGLGRDISERESQEITLREAKEIAEAASLAKSLFLAGMSHELRTPLNAIIGYSELVLEQMDDGVPLEQQRADLQAIRDAGRHLQGMINDVLDLSRIEAGHSRLHIEEYLPSEVANMAARTVAPLVGQNRNALELQIDPEVGVSQGDPGKLRQCLINLLGNAAKFTQGGRISLHVGVQTDAAGDAWLSWRVCDSGIGMTPEQLQRVFDAFAQGDSSITRRYGGTGLGLTLTTALVRLMDGRLDVQSTPGKGTCFTLTLPRYLAARPEDPEA